MNKKISKLRRRIDKLDWRLMRLLSFRLKLAQKIGEIKKAEQMPVLDEARERELMNARQAWAQKLGLDPERAREVFKLILEQSKKEQK
ncbi:MAG: chorismate mutase [Candidatus Magasanikbacteria bacterium CG10_big_fil_rev_8_21_14_0_10_40_10]|uniref:Chorismate mutase n=1 Tax=Candidatus Magasanikbacteria bacterium CG10_big_fil_rev_8_21_14_0_10_40_10 TaxID=1974648 RepID=A0A2M6W435_9BACT|nr:MAG: chorismate mutase [Candidatus Magasanikbacteria bacterium CG10_big_fil_rev_8_21_14_0_10_40_10]